MLLGVKSIREIFQIFEYKFALIKSYTTTQESGFNCNTTFEPLYDDESSGMAALYTLSLAFFDYKERRKNSNENKINSRSHKRISLEKGNYFFLPVGAESYH